MMKKCFSNIIMEFTVTIITLQKLNFKLNLYVEK
jgi:hypothetical protein